jgi:hypothetical protein
MDRKPAADHDARAYVRQWEARSRVLDADRLRELRALSETDAARRFELLTRGVRAAEQRSTSGLVEQQRIFARLRRGEG